VRCKPVGRDDLRFKTISPLPTAGRSFLASATETLADKPKDQQDMEAEAQSLFQINRYNTSAYLPASKALQRLPDPDEEEERACQAPRGKVALDLSRDANRQQHSEESSGGEPTVPPAAPLEQDYLSGLLDSHTSDYLAAPLQAVGSSSQESSPSPEEAYSAAVVLREAAAQVSASSAPIAPLGSTSSLAASTANLSGTASPSGTASLASTANLSGTTAASLTSPQPWASTATLSATATSATSPQPLTHFHSLRWTTAETGAGKRIETGLNRMQQVSTVTVASQPPLACYATAALAQQTAARHAQSQAAAATVEQLPMPSPQLQAPIFPAPFTQPGQQSAFAIRV